MKRLSVLILVLASVGLSACQFFAPAANDQTLVAQNAELGTQIAAVRSTATVDADRLQVTLEFFQTAIGHVDGQTQALQATMVAQGTLPASIDINAITPDIPITLTTPAPIIEDNSNPQITPISITPGSGGADAPPLQLAPATPGADATNAVAAGGTPGAPTSGGSLTNIVTAEKVGSDDCATRTTTTFSTATGDIYVVATASGLTPKDKVTSRWSANGAEVISYDWSPNFDIKKACIWFYIDQSEVKFTPGDWQVQLEINGAPVGQPAAFAIVASTAAGDSAIDQAVTGPNATASP